MIRLSVSLLILLGFFVGSVFSGALSDIENSGVIPGFTSSVGKEAESTGDLPVLFGIFIFGNKKKAFIFDKSANLRVEVKEGDSVGVYKVERILKNRVILSDGKRTYELKPFSKEAALYRTSFSKIKIVTASSFNSKPPSSKSSSSALAEEAVSGVKAEKKVPSRKKPSSLVSEVSRGKGSHVSKSKSAVGENRSSGKSLFPTGRRRVVKENPFIKLLRNIKK